MEDVLTQFKADDFDFTRVAVIGCPGSGKTTFSNNLGHMLGRKVTHLDKLLWKPGGKCRRTMSGTLSTASL